MRFFGNYFHRMWCEWLHFCGQTWRVYLVHRGCHRLNHPFMLMGMTCVWAWTDAWVMLSSSWVIEREQRIMVKYWMTNSSDWTHKRSDFDIGYFLPCAHWPRSRTSKKNKTNTIIRSQLIQRFAFFHPPELYDHLKRFGRRPTSTLIIIIH